MEHKAFRISSLISGICIVAIAATFNYFSLTNDPRFYLKLLLKSAPVLILLLLNISYFIHYKVTVYSSLMSFGLFFCLIGDILLSLYDPKFNGNINNKNLCLMVGGITFLTARVIFLLMFILYGCKISKYNIKKLLICHIAFNAPFLTLGILNLVYDNYSKISITILIYAIFGFGFQLSYSFLRINAIKEESINSCIFGFLGILAFNLSDTLLLITMLTSFFPVYVITISDNIYWTGMFLLTISIVRSKEEFLEKGNYYNALTLI